jgi:enterochelin esterase-like enzyme
LYQTRQLPYSIVVTPDGNDLRPFRLGAFDPEYYDGKNGNVDTLLGSELPTLIKSQYRTWSNPQLWALGGLSSGGWGALNIGLRHLNQFNVFFSLIGYFSDKSGAENSPLLAVQGLPRPMLGHIHVYEDAGMNDTKHPLFLSSSREFHQVLDRLRVDNVFYPFPGGHGSSGPDFGSNYVRKHAVDALSFVGRNFQAALKLQR